MPVIVSATRDDVTNFRHSPLGISLERLQFDKHIRAICDSEERSHARLVAIGQNVAEAILENGNANFSVSGVICNQDRGYSAGTAE
jgi:hypothetical protein